MIVTGIKRQGQAAPNCQNSSILAASFLIYANDLCQREGGKERKKSSFLKDDVNISDALAKE